MIAEIKPSQNNDILEGISIKEDGSFYYTPRPKGPFFAGCEKTLELLKQLAREQGRTVREIIE